LTNIISPVSSDEKRPLWSVMIPSYNPGKYFIEAVNSVVSQNYSPDEMQIEVVDDCSPDVDVEKIVNENWKGRVGFYRQPENIGHSFNFTDCIRRAKGEFIQILHTDDLVEEGFYKKFGELFHKYQNAGAVFCRQKYIDDDGNDLFYSEPEMQEEGILDDALIKLAEKQRIQYCAIAVRRKVFEHLGGFIEKNIGCEDWEMWVRIAGSYPVVYEPKALAAYRVHNESSMTRKDMRTGQDMRDLMESARIFTAYLPKEKQKEVTLFRNKHYATYSFSNAKRMYEEFNDEEGAAAQLSETIKLNSEIVYANIDFLEKFKQPIEEAGVSVIINCQDDEESIDITLRSLVNQRVPKFIPWEIIFTDNSSTDKCVKIATDSWKKYRSKTKFKIISLNDSSIFGSRKAAIEIAKYNFIVFCNPGTLLNINYIENVSKKMMEDCSVGIMGGYSEAQSQIPLPKWFDNRNSRYYQVGEQFEHAGDMTWSRGYMWSAGMVMRKEAWESLNNKNFISRFKSVKNKFAFSAIDKELGYAFRQANWRIKYVFDLKLKIFIPVNDLSWKHLRELWNQNGKNSVILNSYPNTSNNKIEDFRKIQKKSNYRKLIYEAYCKLKLYRNWKLRSYSETLQSDKDILPIEYLTGRLTTLLKNFKTYNEKVRILKRIFRKNHYKYLKYVIGDVYSKFPQYKIKNTKNGISIILNYQNSSPHLLGKSLEKISQQITHKDFSWEVILVSGFIEKEVQNKIFQIWKDSNCRANLRIENVRDLTKNKVSDLAIEKCSFEYLIFMNETDFLKPDYVRIAYKVIRNNKNAAIVGGQTEFASNVKPPNWFNIYKTFYAIGAPAKESGDITFENNYLWKAALVMRKSALNQIKKKNVGLDFTYQTSKINSFPYDVDLATIIKLSGWKIFYEERLRSDKFVPVKFFNWKYLREIHNITGGLEIRKTAYSNFLSGNYQNGNREASWIYSANKTLGQINKYPLRKIFSGKNKYKNDNEVLEIERLKGKFKELISSKNKNNTLAAIINSMPKANGFTSSKTNGNDSIKSDTIKKKGVSIVICCYNSANILPATLKYIFHQNISRHIPWEVIIVDNASTDNTSEVAQNAYNKYNCLAPFKIVKEPTPGLSEARQRGFNSAKYEYILFCDDDNLLEKDFVRYVYEIMNTNEEIGVLGGQSKPEFDFISVPWFEEWESSFAIGKQFKEDGDITWSRGYIWGAAMVVRKEAWKKLQSKGFKTILSDRKGNTLSAGGDTEICYAIRNEGWKIWYDSRLKFKHYLPIERLNWVYLRKLFRGFGHASVGLDYYLKTIPKKFRSLNKNPTPKSKRVEIHKTISTLRNIRYKKLLPFNRKREGDTDIPMLEYCLGRLEGLVKTRGTYNRGLKMLKRITRKKDYPYLFSVFKDYNKRFPRYNNITKYNGVSVIVCTYNGAERLAETIRHIAKQKINPKILWEVILVDNASNDNSKEVVINEWKRHRTNAKLIIVDQPIPGKQLALEKGYEVAKYEYWITCDDDNWLDQDFVQLTYEIMSGNEKIGALGGPNEPVCEIDPPDWFKYFKRDYAAGTQPDVHTGKVSEGNITWKRGYVWGAGMIVRKSAWEKLLMDGFKTSMSCRKGNELSSGGDSEACYALVLAGWQIWYDSRLKLKHGMPAGRLDWNYLLRLFIGFGTATVGLELYEKAIKLAHADAIDSNIVKKNWWYEFKRALSELRRYGIRKILSLRLPQYNKTDILMLEFYISKLKELIRVRKEYDKNFEIIRNAPWKKDFKQLKAEHRKYIEQENDFRYGWPWNEEPIAEKSGIKSFPKISILSPSFNSEGTIEKAILSVLKQGYPNFEHIICDAGSTDGTVEILKKYSHLKWVSEPDKGQSDAMNKAFHMSNGDIIAYLNVDDYFQRNAFFKIVEAFNKDPFAEMVIGNLFFDYAEHTFSRVPEIEYKKIMLPFRHMFPINPVSYFYKREVQEKIGPFPIENHLTMDYWFLLKAYQDYKLTQIGDYLGTFCMNGYNKTSNANNRKNTHVRVLYHCWHYDKKNLPYYLFNYYKHFYYDTKPWNLNNVINKTKKYFRRIHSIITFKKNKYYSQKLFERSRYRYFEKKRLRSIGNILTSFLIYPKGLSHRSKQTQFLYSVLGLKYTEKAKVSYFFLTTPPGLPLANKLHYYGTKFKNDKKSIKGNLLLLLTYLVSPNFIFKNKKLYPSKNKKPFVSRIFYFLNPINWLRKLLNFFGFKNYREISYEYFYKAGEKYFFHKNIQATILMILSFLIYPFSLKKQSRLNLFAYSFLGDTITEKLKFAYHLYKDNPEHSLAHKLNYYGNELRKEYSTVKGNLILMLAYILSPKYITKREKVRKSNIVYASQFVIPKKAVSHKPKIQILQTAHKMKRIKYSSHSVSVFLHNFYLKSEFGVKKFYQYFKYRKYKARSKELYKKAIVCYNDNKRFKVITLLVPSYILYPKSIINKNKFSLIINSILGEKLIKRIRG